ncbi:alpha/beta hydrolase-fold protein [Zunongwangia sp. F260]|uniref:Alpha/beta hydrolase-fold protein n=1 Tax=Autumnicola lenta TaxID=3075593 RepID=A0ABU3CNX6_9FLAO|nr:alpha/beta hydrolase-fold protein [Zunongwangia sp. F260]MDT0648054.1 alpha/beta hydrolase-fold protein [Zunongwangia sp. F260]
MKDLIFCCLFFLFPILICTSQSQQDIPKGEIKGPYIWKSKIYPGTEREYWIYVPQQYDQNKPACLMVMQDGLPGANWWNLPTALDSLIATQKIPVIIGVLIGHGKVAAENESFPRYNRSFEYDATGDNYSRLLMEEILPEVNKTYNISSDPNDRSIAGASSGAIAAFNVAWEHPDAFRRVMSAIGSYVHLRGGEDIPKLIRVSEPRPIRVFLEDGSNDLNIYAGDWWMANQTMLSALKWSGYEVEHNWGDGGHSGEHAASIISDALTWLWKDYPEPVKTHPENTSRRVDVLIPGEPWKEIPLKNLKADQIAVNQEGEIFFSEEKAVYKLNETGDPVLFAELNSNISGLSFHSDGKLYIGDPENRKLLSINNIGNIAEVISDVEPKFLAVSNKGIYFSEAEANRIGFFNFTDKELQYFDVPGEPGGLAISAEQTFLNVAISDGLFGYSFKIEENGSLNYGQDYIHYYKPYGNPFPLAEGLAVDSDNNVYTATSLGIQVSDQLGRINFIFSNPEDNPTDVKIGGENFNTLYLSANGKIFSRKINAKGVLSWKSPVTPPEPGL